MCGSPHSHHMCECKECVAFSTCLLFSMLVLQVDLDQHHTFA